MENVEKYIDIRSKFSQVDKAPALTKTSPKLRYMRTRPKCEKWHTLYFLKGPLI